MRSYKLKDTYYDCKCGGTFYVDLNARSYGISPCIYSFVCDKCNQRKFMPNKDEMRLMTDIKYQVRKT